MAPQASKFAQAMRVIAAVCFTGISSLMFAQWDAPAGYYSSANGLTGTSLKSALHNIIDDHTKRTYAQVWTALHEVDEDPNNANNVLTIYSNQSIPKTSQDGSSSASILWNREHSFPKSYGFDTASWPAYTDIHHLFASNKQYNSARNNRYFDNLGSGNTLRIIHTLHLIPLMISGV